MLIIIPILDDSFTILRSNRYILYLLFSVMSFLRCFSVIHPFSTAIFKTSVFPVFLYILVIILSIQTPPNQNSSFHFENASITFYIIQSFSIVPLTSRALTRTLLRSMINIYIILPTIYHNAWLYLSNP